MKHPRPRSHVPRRSRPADHLSARRLAYEAIAGFARRGAFVSRVLDDYFDTAQLDPREKRLATELASEVVRRRLTLNAVLSAYINRPPESIDLPVWIVLQLGACQLLCLSRIPPHAAIHETVELCETLRLSRAKGFVNGVLRNLLRGMREEPAEFTAGPLLDRRSLPIAGWDEGVWKVRTLRFDRAVIADQSAGPLAQLSQIVSLPEWLLERWGAGGDTGRAELLQRGLYFSTQGKLGLRVNPLRATREQVLAALDQAGIAAEPGPLPEAIRPRGSLAVTDLAPFRDGWCSVQDESAMAAVDLLSPQPGETILDLCAAPGGKTCHLAERLAGSGLVVARDVSAERLRDVTDNARRLGLENIITELSAMEVAAPVEPDGFTQSNSSVPRNFDAVLVDVPCSNTGVLGKRPEARWRLSPESFTELTMLQLRLLEDALNTVRPGGRVVYSTCSIDQEENSGIVQAILHGRSDVELVRESIHEPGAPSDGGYQALLVRK